MPRRNRVDPWGDLHAVGDRGIFTGNRGCLVDNDRRVVRHHRGSLWISCVTEFGDRRFPLERPGSWTPIFFLDDAVALAAGHRPCGYCRREAYRSYQGAVSRAEGLDRPIGAQEMNRRLATERLRRGRGLIRAADRLLWVAPIEDLPVGSIVVANGRRPQLLLEDRLLEFSFAGWGRPTPRLPSGVAEVLTPPTSVAALAHGYRPVLHPTAMVDGG